MLENLALRQQFGRADANGEIRRTRRLDVLRDRDAIYGDVFRRGVATMGIGEVVSRMCSRS